MEMDVPNGTPAYNFDLGPVHNSLMNLVIDPEPATVDAIRYTHCRIRPMGLPPVYSEVRSPLNDLRYNERLALVTDYLKALADSGIKNRDDRIAELAKEMDQTRVPFISQADAEWAETPEAAALIRRHFPHLPLSAAERETATEELLEALIVNPVDPDLVNYLQNAKTMVRDGDSLVERPRYWRTSTPAGIVYYERPDTIQEQERVRDANDEGSPDATPLPVAGADYAMLQTAIAKRLEIKKAAEEQDPPAEPVSKRAILARGVPYQNVPTAWISEGGAYIIAMVDAREAQARRAEAPTLSGHLRQLATASAANQS